MQKADGGVHDPPAEVAGSAVATSHCKVIDWKAMMKMIASRKDNKYTLINR